MKHILRFAMVLLALASASAWAELTLGEAIDKAGEQRMLSQRIAHSYLLSLLQPNSTKGVDRMTRAIARFERNLEALEGFDSASSLAPELARVATQWASYKALALSEVNDESADRLLQASDSVLAAAHSYVGLLEKLSDSGVGEVVNISGKQRMLSQRIAKNYFAYLSQLGGEERIKALYEDLAEYESVLGYLQQSALNTPEIAAKLNKVEGQFAYASKGFDGLMQITGDRLIYVITGTTDSMLKNMDDVTKMYAALP